MIMMYLPKYSALCAMAACFSILFNVSRAATYYVAPTGSDSNPGSLSQPWLTQQQAWNSMVAGDTTLVQPGIYRRSNGFDATVNNGTPTNLIVMKAAYGTVTNMYGIRFQNNYTVWDGFIISGAGDDNPSWNMPDYDAIEIDAPASGPMFGAVVQNCGLFNNEIGTGGVRFSGRYNSLDNVCWASNGPTLCIVSNVTISGFGSSSTSRTADDHFINVSGLSNLVVNCYLNYGLGSDFFYAFGAHNIFRGNVCRNLIYVPGVGNHPDFFQTFGSYDGGSGRLDHNIEVHDIIVEDNYIEHCEGGICQLEYYPVAGVTAPLPFGNIIFRNNIYKDFSDPNAGASVDIPGVQFINNTFINCSQGISYQFYSFTNWSRTDPGPYPGTATGGAVINNLFINCGAITLQIDNNFPGGPGYPSSIDTKIYNNYVVSTNGNGGWKNVTPAYLTTNYPSTNYHSVLGWPSNYAINSGQDPKLVIGQSWTPYATNSAYTPIGAYRPMLGSPLIDAGTNLLSSDIEGTARPLGSASDIGCFEFDPSLKLHLDFNEDFSRGKVLDVTGNTNDGWSMNVVPPGQSVTNWITKTAGINQSYAALFTTNGVMSNDPGQTYNLSTYIAVTNLNGFEYLTNGTISIWAWFNPNVDYAIRLLDNGFNQTYATGSSANSWMLGRNYATMLSFVVYPGSGGISNVINFPDDVIKDQGSAPYNYGTTNWHLYTVTVNCPSNQIIGYYDGQPFYTNALNLPYLHVYGCGSQRWLCIGAMSHDGTPQWGDDAYPNDGFMIGKLDDIRIYNRTLGPTAVKDLLLFGSQAQQSGTAVLIPPSGFRVIKPQ
jgi:Concanavalin A-like lectin/glucanases superfamily